MKHTLLLLSILLCSCGYFEDRYEDHIDRKYEKKNFPDEDITSDLWSYVEDFRQDANDRGINVDREIDKLRVLIYEEINEPPVIGQCFTYYRPDGGVAYTKIRVEPDMADRCLLKALMYHELGHCILGRGHREGETHALMSPSLYGCSYYESKWELYVDDLFCNTKGEDKLVSCSKMDLFSLTHHLHGEE